MIGLAVFAFFICLVPAFVIVNWVWNSVQAWRERRAFMKRFLDR